MCNLRRDQRNHIFSFCTNSWNTVSGRLKRPQKEDRRIKYFFKKFTSSISTCLLFQVSLIFSDSACLVAQSRLTLSDPMDYSPPGSSVHGVLQARILEWVAMPSSRGSSRPRDQTRVSHFLRKVDSLPLVPPGKSLRWPILEEFSCHVKVRTLLKQPY